MVWGNWGRDTYYASQWFWQDGVQELQSAPRGATSLVIKISYNSTTEGYKPTSFSVAEVLGTISETMWLSYGSPSLAATSGLIWTGNVYSNGTIATGPTLQSGKTYRIVATQIFWYNYPNLLEADAMYYTTSNVNWQWPAGTVYPAPGGHSFLQINGQDVNWGPFSNGDTGHTYTTTYTGQGTPITFQIVDCVDHNYANNECHLVVYIYVQPVYKGGLHDP
jgi:hypothetical protein